MSELDGTHATTLKRPTNNDEEAWRKYWKAQGQAWRWEPEISKERQEYLAEIKLDVNQFSPFKDIDPKPSRADIEWLLLTYENGRGPIDWGDENQLTVRG